MKQDIAHAPRGHFSCLNRLISLVYLLSYSHIAAGRLAVGSGNTRALATANLLTAIDTLWSSPSAFSRGILQEETIPELTASDGKWEGVEPCPALVELITATPRASSRLGNFTEIPQPEVIRECSISSGLYLLSGEELADAVAEPTPLLKIMVLETSDPTIWPEGNGGFNSAPGSVNIIDCQDGFLDLRNRHFSLFKERATTVYSRCIVIYPDTNTTSTALTYWYDATAIFPCNGTGLLSLQASIYDQSTQARFPELSANIAQDSSVHMRNASVWCYDDVSLRELLAEYVRAEKTPGGGTSLLPAWIPCLITICALLVLFVIGAAVWMGLGRPRCSCQPKKANPPQQAQQPIHVNNRSIPLEADGSAFNYRSAELAAALNTVLKTHKTLSRFQDDGSCTSKSQYQDHAMHALHALHEHPDCGQSEYVSGRSRSRKKFCENKPSLRAHSDSPSTSTRDGRQRNHCSAHLESGGEASALASEHCSDLELPPRAYSGTSRARHEGRDPRTRHAGMHSAPPGKKSTNQWVEDSFDAREQLQVAGDVRLGPGRERFSDVDTVSIDERCSIASISFAPPRRREESSGRVLNAFIRSSGNRGGSSHLRAGGGGASQAQRPSNVESTVAPSEKSQYFDAHDTGLFDAQDTPGPDAASQGHSCSAASSRKLPDVSPAHSDDLPSNWLPPRTGFLSLEGSPRHPGLKEYDSPPATHPILSGRSRSRKGTRGGNDEEGAQ